MGAQVIISLLGFGGTLLLVTVGLLNFSVFRKQLRLAQEQIETAITQLDISRKQPEIQLIQRAITETTDHVRVLVEKPYLRPYFYEDKAWREGDPVSGDEVKAMAELLLTNFASALMHAAAFPQYPVNGIDRIIMFHLRRSPAVRSFLFESFDRYPLTGLTLLILKNDARAEVEADLRRLVAAAGDDERERRRREGLLRLLKTKEHTGAIQFTKFSMEKGALGL
jgi:hypothetical protein